MGRSTMIVFYDFDYQRFIRSTFGVTTARKKYTEDCINIIVKTIEARPHHYSIKILSLSCPNPNPNPNPEPMKVQD